MEKIKSILIVLLLLLMFGSKCLAQIRPTAINDTGEMLKNSAGVFNVLSNDIFDKNRPIELSLIKIENKNQGEIYFDTLRKFGDSSIYYKPTPFYYGDVIISYWVFYSDSGLITRDTGYLYVSVKNYSDKRFDTLSSNNIVAGFHSNGDLFWDYSNKFFRVPKNENNNSIFAAALWCGGIDDSNDLHIAASTYSNLYPGGNGDFKAGPIATAYSKAYNEKYDRIWKVNKELIQNHINNFKNPGYIIPEVIANWPAHGNTSNGEGARLARFVDYDSNGVYDPQNGDYPYLIGDELILFIYNDDKAHLATEAPPLKVEIYAYAYQFKSDTNTVLNNTLFIKYDIINRSDRNYKDFFVGNWVDFDLGYAYDDYLGSNPKQNLFYAYNGKNNDSLGYGINPPVMTVQFLNKKLNYFMVYNNSYSLNGIPTDKYHYYYYMKAMYKNGQPLRHADTITHYMYPDNPSNDSGWSEVTAGNIYGDRMGVGSTGSFDFAINDTISFDVAYMYSRQQGKSNLENVDVSFLNSKRLKDIYDTIDFNPKPMNQTSGFSYPAKSKINIFPNPSNGLFFIDTKENITCSLTDHLGRIIYNNLDTKYIDISDLPDGIYVLKIYKSGRSLIQQSKIIKL